MNRLLTTDLHLTDNPLDSYRWDIFSFLCDQARKHDVQEIDILGDLVDRKDRHSANLVNCLVDAFADLKFESRVEEIRILAGNHDKPLRPPYYWEFLNRVGIQYIVKPDMIWGVLFLPFSANAIREWKEVLQWPLKVIFMHQTVEGAVVEDDRRIPSSPYPLPPFPSIPIYSGDVHRPQKINNLCYVGAPHPVRFSETWRNRIILIQNDDFEHPIDIWVPGVRRAIVDVTSDCDFSLGLSGWKAGDQLKIRYQLKAEELLLYSEEEHRIKEWAGKNGITIVSIEPTLIGDGVKKETTANESSILPPETVLKNFAKQEKLSDENISMGLEILNESK